MDDWQKKRKENSLSLSGTIRTLDMVNMRERQGTRARERGRESLYIKEKTSEGLVFLYR